MWTKTQDTEDLFEWRADPRTASTVEQRTALHADPVSGEVRLMYAQNGEAGTIVFPPAVARTIGAALIEAGIIASGTTQ